MEMNIDSHSVLEVAILYMNNKQLACSPQD